MEWDTIPEVAGSWGWCSKQRGWRLAAAHLAAVPCGGAAALLEHGPQLRQAGGGGAASDAVVLIDHHAPLLTCTWQAWVHWFTNCFRRHALHSKKKPLSRHVFSAMSPPAAPHLSAGPSVPSAQAQSLLGSGPPPGPLPPCGVRRRQRHPGPAAIRQTAPLRSQMPQCLQHVGG